MTAVCPTEDDAGYDTLAEYFKSLLLYVTTAWIFWSEAYRQTPLCTRGYASRRTSLESRNPRSHQSVWIAMYFRCSVWLGMPHTSCWSLWVDGFGFLSPLSSRYISSECSAVRCGRWSIEFVVNRYFRRAVLAGPLVWFGYMFIVIQHDNRFILSLSSQVCHRTRRQEPV